MVMEIREGGGQNVPWVLVLGMAGMTKGDLGSCPFLVTFEILGMQKNHSYHRYNKKLQ